MRKGQFNERSRKNTGRDGKGPAESWVRTDVLVDCADLLVRSDFAYTVTSAC